MLIAQTWWVCLIKKLKPLAKKTIRLAYGRVYLQIHILINHLAVGMQAENEKQKKKALHRVVKLNKKGGLLSPPLKVVVWYNYSVITSFWVTALPLMVVCIK